MKIATNFTINNEILTLVGEIMEVSGTFKTHGTMQAMMARAKKRPALPDPLSVEGYEERINRPVKAEVKKTFAWLKKNEDKTHALLISSLFAYQLTVFTPLEDSESQIALAYFKAILRRFRPLFGYLPMEKRFQNRQEGYQKALKEAGEKGDIGPYICFMLTLVRDSLVEAKDRQTGFEGRKSPCVEKLLSVMELNKEYTSRELVELLGLKSRVTVKRNYIQPALRGRYIKMLLPGKPHSPNQRYYRHK